jgi:hypothetical protein
MFGKCSRRLALARSLRIRVAATLFKSAASLAALIVADSPAWGHGGDGHIDLPPVNQLSGSVDSDETSWFIGVSSITRMGMRRDDDGGEAGEHDGDEVLDTDHDHHDGPGTGNSVLLSPSLGIQLNARWAFLASQSIDFANLIDPAATHERRRPALGDPSLTAIHSATIGKGNALISSFSVLVPLSEESKEVSRSVGAGISTFGSIYLSSSLDLIPSVQLTHYLKQVGSGHGEQAQTQLVAGGMLRYSIRRWNAALQLGGRLQQGRARGELTSKFLYVVPLRADLNLRSWALSLYPEVRTDLRQGHRQEIFAVLEGLYSFSYLGRPNVQAAAGPSQEIRHEHGPGDAHDHLD